MVAEKAEWRFAVRLGVIIDRCNLPMVQLTAGSVLFCEL